MFPLTATSRTRTAASNGPRPSTRSSPSSLTLCAPSVPTSMDGACTKRWPSGRPNRPWLPSRISHVVSTSNTGLERRFDPDSVRDMKTSAASDLTVGGPTLAAHAFGAGLVDECQLFIHPVLVGEGKPAFPSDARIQLELVEERRFGNGVVNLRYRIQS